MTYNTAAGNNDVKKKRELLPQNGAQPQRTEAAVAPVNSGDQLRKVSTNVAAAPQKPAVAAAPQSTGGYQYQPYQKSDAVLQAEQLLQQQMNNKPGAYQSTWSNQMNAIMDRIMNREDFSYDLNGDMLYQQLKDSAMLQGQKAMMDTMGQAAAMTGGYGNSYAQLAGQQAYQGQMQQLNDKAPELYQLALDRYNQQGQDLYNQYGMYADREAQDYGRYRDRVSDYYTELDRLADAARYQSEQDYGRYTDQVNRDYGIHRDQVADQQWQASFDYGKSRDEVADSQWQQQFDTSNQQWQQSFDYQQGRDQAEDAYRDKVFDYEAGRDAVADQQWRESFEYGKTQDDIANQQWQQSFDYQQGRDQAEDAYRDKVFDYEAGRDAVADQQWRESFEYGKTQDDIANQQWQQSFDYQKNRDAVEDGQWQQEFGARYSAGNPIQNKPLEAAGREYFSDKFRAASNLADASRVMEEMLAEGYSEDDVFELYDDCVKGFEKGIKDGKLNEKGGNKSTFR